MESLSRAPANLLKPHEPILDRQLATVVLLIKPLICYIFRNFAITKASPMEESGNKLEPIDNHNNTSLLPIESLIHVIRGQQVMIDSDLARLYGVETKRLKEQVRRNISRFPEDFMFELTKEELQFSS